MDKSTKAAVLSLHDPVGNIRTLKYQSIDVDWAVEVSPNLRVWTGFDGNDDVSKMLRIFTCNSIIICPHREITSKTSEAGLYWLVSSTTAAGPMHSFPGSREISRGNKS